MQKHQRLRKSREFAAVRRQGRSWSNRYLVLIACRNDTETTRFGFSVGKRIGKAVVRNKVKRRLRELARSSNIPGGWDLVFIARKDASTADFQGLNGSMSNLLERAGLLKVSNQELNDSKGRSIPAE